jgi:hypothetical protein
MKVKIIKRTEREKAAAKIPTADAEPKSRDVLRAMTAAVNSWIDDSRQKHASEAALFNKLFKEEYCS